MSKVFFYDGEWMIGKTNLYDLPKIAQDIRPEDQEELYAASDKDVLVALKDSMEHSHFAFTVKKFGNPLMIFGVAPYSLLTKEVCCWAVAVNDLKFSGSKFLRYSRDVVDALNRSYPVMSNYVGDWNTTALRWLKWCGFTVEPARRIGIHGEMMHRVERRGF